MSKPPSPGPGRPTKYSPSYIPRARELAEGGLTNPEIARALGIGHTTFREWRARHAEFRAAVKMGKDAADDLVEESLFQKAVGYVIEDVETSTSAKTGRTVTKKVQRRVEPDVIAQIFWLKNRRPDQWREKSTIEVTGDLAQRLAAARARTKGGNG